jgi:hypothetical protein
MAAATRASVAVACWSLSAGVRAEIYGTTVAALSALTLRHFADLERQKEERRAKAKADDEEEVGGLVLAPALAYRQICGVQTELAPDIVDPKSVRSVASVEGVTGLALSGDECLFSASREGAVDIYSTDASVAKLEPQTSVPAQVCALRERLSRGLTTQLTGQGIVDVAWATKARTIAIATSKDVSVYDFSTDPKPAVITLPSPPQCVTWTPAGQVPPPLRAILSARCTLLMPLHS